VPRAPFGDTRPWRSLALSPLTQNAHPYSRLQLFSAYWNNPEATAKAFDHDGWFRTGDTADRDGDGYVTLLGRTSSDIIKHKGYKLSALQIESALLEHDFVEEACVFGAPDEDAGEALVAVVCGDHLDSVTDAGLDTWCRGRLAPYQVPSIWFRLQRLPRNHLGKVNKTELRGSLLGKSA
jgi:malonyl-CoA/methylmalonyl-CoA synthetase